MNEHGRASAAGVFLAGAYWLAAVVGLHWAAVGGAGSPVWPAAGVALAGLLLGGVRLWPAVVVGRLAAALTVGSAQPLWVDVLIAGGNALAAVLPALALRRHARLDPHLATMRDALWLVAGAALGAAVAAGVGTGALWLAAGFGPARAAVVATNWWFGNLVGALTVAPLALAWSAREARAMPAAAWGHLAAVLAATAALSYFIFVEAATPYLRSWSAFPVLIWAALAFQARGAAAALLIVSASATGGATAGVGPFVDLADTPIGRASFAQQFAAAASLTTLVLAAVADERRGKEALRASEEFNRRVLDSSGDRIEVLSLDAGLESMSSGGMSAMEVDDFGTVRGACWPDFWRDGAHEAALAAVQAARAGGTGRFQGFCPTAKGTPKWWDVVVNPIMGADGRPEKLLSISRDVTEQKRAEQALAARGTRLRLLAEMAGHLLHATDPQEVLTGFLKAAPADFGLDVCLVHDADEAGRGLRLSHALGVDEATAVALRELPHDDAACGRVAAERRAVTWGLSASADPACSACRTIGLRAYAGFPLPGPDGAVLGVLAFGSRRRDAFSGQDIEFFAAVAGNVAAVRKRLVVEGELRALNAELERRVVQEAAKLVQSQKMEGIGQLTGGIAHDFNNLLAVVLGNLERLRKRLPPGDTHAVRLLDNTAQGARRGAALTQRLLAFARKQDLRPEPVGVPGLVFGMTDLLSRSIGPQVEIETRFAAGVPEAMVDAHQLEMAVLNLAVNARDAMPEGGTLTVEVDEQRIGAGGALPPGSYVRLRVSDTGAGIDAATLARATEPFFTTKGVGKGTGLGLSMAHGLAHQSGGRLRLESEPGRGTTAEILLPVASASTASVPVVPVGAEAAVPPPAWMAGHDGPGGRGLSVLVVDDDALVRDNTAGMLRDLGHAVVEAESAQQALDILRGGRVFVAVVTDHSMPGMTGAQLATAIEAEWPGLPVVLATGYAELPESALGAVRERLTKPFQQGQLATALAQATGAARAGGVVPPPGHDMERFRVPA